MRTARITRATMTVALAVSMIAGSSAPAEALDLGPSATYLVRVTPTAKAAVEAAIGKIGGNVESRYNYVFDGFKIKLPVIAYAVLSKIPNVLSIEPDRPMVSLSPEYAESPTPSWGLDRIDQRTAVGSGTSYTSSFGYKSSGRGATIYVADTGISAHADIAGRLSTSGYSGFADGNGTSDCNGHGTHVATTAAGTQYGVAKNATVVPIRILNCSGSGAVSGVIAGLDWILSPLNPNPKTAAVVNMSIGGPASTSLNTAIERLTNAGIAVVVAAGNANVDACTTSPASAATAITVGATERIDSKASYSNWGSCIDINAPGSSITAGWFDSPTSARTISGTSMATPHVAGAAAVFYGLNPNASVAQLTQYLDTQSTLGAISGLPVGTANKLLYVSPTDGAAPLALPTAALRSVTGVTHNAAAVAYDINPGGDDTTLKLQYSTSAAMSNALTVDWGTVTGYDATSMTANLSGLTPSTRYYVQVVGTNSKGTASSDVSSFVTNPPPVIAPTVSGLLASDVTAYSATLTGMVSAGNAIAQVRFMYTTNAAFASGITTIAASPASLSGNLAASVSVPLSFLTGGTTYYVKLAATNSSATTVSDVYSFKTPVAPGLAPSVVTNKTLPSPMSTNAKFTGTVHPQSQTTTVKFVYGTVSGLTSGTTTITLADPITGASATPVTAIVPSLTPGKGYYYRFDAANASGLTRGNVEYSIVQPVAPTVKSVYGNNQTTISAKFNAVANAGGSNTRWVFEYTTDPDFKTGITSIQATPFAVTGATDTTVTATPTNLVADTWYYFRARVDSYTGPSTGVPIYGPIARIQTLRPTLVVSPSPSPTPTASPTPTTSPTPTPTPTNSALAQTITFGPIADREFGAGISLTATASSKLAVVYASATPSVCQILDLGAGNFAVQTATTLPDVDTAKCTVFASQPGNATYAAAAAVSQSFTWRRAAMRIWTGTFAPKLGVQSTLNAWLALVDAKLMSGLVSLNSQIAVTSMTPTICRVDSSMLLSATNPYTTSKVTGLAKGTCTLSLSYGATKRRAPVSINVSGTVA